jgi:hypothetical protein
VDSSCDCAGDNDGSAGGGAGLGACVAHAASVTARKATCKARIDDIDASPLSIRRV